MLCDLCSPGNSQRKARKPQACETDARQRGNDRKTQGRDRLVEQSKSSCVSMPGLILFSVCVSVCLALCFE